MSKDQAEEPVVMNQVHTYPDGSQVVGCPPFPKKSPIERAAEAATASPEPDASDLSSVVTADHVETSLVQPTADAPAAAKAPRKNAKKAK